MYTHMYIYICVFIYTCIYIPMYIYTSSRKNWRILQLNRSEIGTTNALQYQVPV